MILARAQPTPLLLLSTAILLHLCVCNAKIHESPTSQVILLGESATYHCSATGSSFRWVINIENVQPINTGNNPLIPEHGITIVINEEYNKTTYESSFMATLSIEGWANNNKTCLYCLVFTFDSEEKSDNATLLIIGPPEPPYPVSVPPQHVDLESRLFSADWNVPYSHSDHPIIGYDITVTNLRTAESFEGSQDHLPSADSGLNITLPFPEQTSSCDILTITVTAVNDIGSGGPAVANLSIPEVPDDDVLISAKVLFDKNGNPLVSLEIKFPPLCIFETLNYTVVLANESLRELVVLQKSVTSPPESITETITSGIVANSNYSVVVLAETDVWKATTTPYNFSTLGAHFTPSTDSSSEMTPTVGAVSPKSTNSSTLILGISAGTAVIVLLFIIVAATILWVMHFRKRKSGLPATIGDMYTENATCEKIENVPCEMTPNPIYDGPLYDTVQEPFMALKLQPVPLPVRAEPTYTESPTQLIQRSVAVSEEVIPHQTEPEDCYVHMHSFQQQS